MHTKGYSLFFLLLLCLPIRGVAQGENVTVKYFGITLHPFGDRLAHLQPYKLDKKAHLVLNFGAFVGYERYIWEDIASVKLTQGLFTDCSAGRAGFTHLGIRGVMYDKGKHHAMVGFGPILFYRESWTRFADYKDKGNFAYAANKAIQYQLFWYGIELEYNYRLSQRTDFSTTITPGVPFVFSYAFGIKYWMNKNFRVRN